MSFRETKIKLDPDNQDIVFQISSWYTEDNDYGDDEEGGEKYLVKVFGVTEDGKSVSVNLLNYTPFFYIKSPYQVTRSTVQNIHEFLVARLPWKLKESLLDVSVIKKKDFWGFTNNEKFNFIRLKFKNLAALRSATRILSKRVDITGISRNPIKFKLYESNIEPFLRMMHIRDIEPTGWVEIKKGTYEINSSILPTHCQIDINCEWTAISKIVKEKIAPLVVASFDLECTSSHGDFPVPKKTYKKTAYELTHYFLDLKNKDKKDIQDIKKILFDEILKVFTPDEYGILSKVFTKNKVNISDLELKLKKSMDDIIAILSGKLGYKKEGEIYTITKDAILKALTKKLGDFEINDQQESWTGLFPPLEGDPIIQIGTTVHLYGEKECCSRFILTLGTCDPIENVDVIACETEKELMLKWRDLIVKIDPDIITGYNIFGFDMSYLNDRAKELGITNDFMKIGRFMDHRSKYVEKELSSSALGDNLLKYIEMEGRVLIDVMKVVQRDHKLDSYKLDAVANHFMKMNKHDVHPSDIFRLQKGSSEDRKKISEYCVQDCALCNHLIMKLEILANNIGMSNVCNVPLSYIFMRGQGIKIFSLVAKECRVYDLLIPTLNNYIKDEDDEDGEADDDGYEGAIVLEPKEGIYIDDPITVLDYASLYPSSMISENLSHDSIILDPKYDNLEGYEYLDIVYDIYEKVDDKKVKKGEKTVRFAQFPDGEKGTIPKILMKLLKQRKETRKKIEFQTVTTKTTSEQYKGLIKEKDDKVIVTSIDGKSTEIIREDIESITDTYDDFQKAVLDGLQLAYKVTANSLYGQCGAKTSAIYLKEIAACTTATGRKMIYMVKEFAEKNYNAEVVYGDTDSCFLKFPIKDALGNTIKGKEAIMPSIQVAKELSAKFKPYLKPPHDAEYEKTFYPFILFSKKRYCANKYEHDDKHCKMASMGIVLKRRDNAHIVKKIYGGILDIILNEQDIKKSLKFLKESLNDLIDGKYPLEDLIISKSLRSDYKDPDRIAHKVLAERMGERDPGNKPQVNDRIPYVYVQVEEKKGKKMLQGERIEHPDYIRDKKLKPDYEFYITNQIMKPILQLYALTLNNLDGYRKACNYFDDIKIKLIKEKDGDMKKVKDRLNDLKEDEVKKLLFDPILIKLANKRNKNTVITDYFKFE